MRTVIPLLLLLISASSYAQVGGERIFNFLNVTTSARQAALGGEILTLTDDINQPLWNPSTINPEIDNQIGLSYVDFLTDVNYGSLSFAHLFTRRTGTFHAGITFVDYGKLIAADEQGNETGTFKARDLAFQIGYAYQLPWQDFYVGANLKFINSTIENFSSNGLAADFALTYYSEFKPYMFTAVIRNVGSQISAFDEEREKLPLDIAVGASYKLEHIPLRWHLTINSLQQWKLGVPNPSDSQTSISGETTNDDISFLGNAIRHVSVGAEFFPDKGFNLRLGYNFRRARELRLVDSRTFAGVTAGFGLKMGRFKLNYAFSKFHPETDTNTFSLNIDLAREGFKRY